MRTAPRTIALIVIVAVVAVGMTAFAVMAGARQRAAVLAAPDVDQVELDTVTTGSRVVFRSTAPGVQYGLAAVVPLEDPAGPRAFTDRACDRIDATADQAICLRTVRGIATTFTAELLDSAWETVRTWPLPGIPSRTRFSPDGTLVSTTVFVSGDSYMSSGFSTRTRVERAEGEGYGDLEDFTLIVDGTPIAPVDRNLWGVTFVDDRTFYATAASLVAGKTWLVRGDLSDRTLTALRENVECPSLSPDGTRVAFKKDVGGDDGKFWSVAVLDLASGVETVLDGEERSIDDQLEWLDDSTLLYGMPRVDEPGVTDVWSIAVAEGSTPGVFIPQAWSPSVVR
ncbi:PD40 domain-containing protein [Cellulomonas fimi]|uniref:WD40-like beta Propeller containing protein n=1 Tax=Cellulomonas fimi TaxID=1708 RepID=A0A7Y0M003_CELFI|nr:PD40 domain-containing protein [Cellulomonas fimi]NMR21342.1 hypothetical protein [Cellulomonas fimi]